LKVLVTGASGRIGRAIYVRLAREHEVVGLDRSPSSTADVLGDITDSQLIQQITGEVDAVVHTAAYHAPHVGLVADSQFRKTNVEATREIAEMARDAGIQQFVFTSTTALYGAAATPGSMAGWVDEELEPEPRTIYHDTKIEAENLLAQIAGGSAMRVAILRMSRCFPEPAPEMAVYRLHRGIDARDVADAHACALTADTPGCRTYIVSGATPFCREDTALLALDAPQVISARAPDLAETFLQRGWDLPQSIDRVYSPARAIAELSWVPRHGYREVLKMLDEQSSEVLPVT
jgi:UDP-glucose 4-epimerase